MHMDIPLLPFSRPNRVIDEFSPLPFLHDLQAGQGPCVGGAFLQGC